MEPTEADYQICGTIGDEKVQGIPGGCESAMNK